MSHRFPGFLLAVSVAISPVIQGAEPLPFLMPSDFHHMERVAWRVEEGQQDDKNPLLEPGKPWDIGGVFSHGTVLKDPLDNRWKAWQISTPLSRPLGPGTWTHDRRLTLLESADGEKWQRPELELVPWEGHDRTNILLGLWSSYASVNIDPEREVPYEMFIFRYPGYPGAGGRIEGLPLPAGEEKHPYGLYRYRSVNGQKWTAVEGPIKLNTTDSCFIYRFSGGQYVAYHKTEMPAFPGGLAPYDIADGGLRLIGRRTSEDGTTWSDPTRLVMTPDWRDPADTQFMELCPMEGPGGFIATLTVYHNHTQRIDLQLAASRDGIHWWRPDRRPALPNPPLGEYGGGMIWPMRRPVQDGDRIYVYYAGNESLHGDLYNTTRSGPRRLKARGEFLSRQSSSLPNYSALCRASWGVGRMWAMVCAIGGPYEGVATTVIRELEGRELHVNLFSRPGGGLRAEILDAGGTPLEGFSEEDCIALAGDHHDVIMHWKGGSRLPENAARIRFLVKRTYLYGFDARR